MVVLDSRGTETVEWQHSLMTETFHFISTELIFKKGVSELLICFSFGT